MKTFALGLRDETTLTDISSSDVKDHKSVTAVPTRLCLVMSVKVGLKISSLPNVTVANLEAREKLEALINSMHLNSRDD